MKNCTNLLLPLLLSCPFKGAGQSYFYNENYYDPEWLWEAGVSGGLMNGLTDIGGGNGWKRTLWKDVSLQDVKACISFYSQFLYQYKWGLRLNASFGAVAASDHNIRNPDDYALNRFQRNLQFRSRIKELQVLAELYPINMITGEQAEAWCYPYLLGGFSAYQFKPEALLDNRWIPLAPLRTEGQGFAEYPDRLRYRTRQIAFPIGAGIRLELSPRIHLRLEGLHRILTTDYLDDVSTNYIDPKLFDKYLNADEAALAKILNDRRQELNPSARLDIGGKRGNPFKNDAFFSFDLRLGWLINRTRR